MIKPFHENSTLTDVELGEIESDLRANILSKSRPVSLISLTFYGYGPVLGVSKRYSWSVTATLEPGVILIQDGDLLHEALNGLLERVKPPVDLATVLGYQDRLLEP